MQDCGTGLQGVDDFVTSTVDNLDRVIVRKCEIHPYIGARRLGNDEDRLTMHRRPARLLQACPLNPEQLMTADCRQNELAALDPA
mgnify:CR=1 FL=1